MNPPQFIRPLRRRGEQGRRHVERDSQDETLWNVRPRASVTSLRFDVGCADHFAPFLRFIGDELAEISRRACNCDAAEPHETGLHRSISKAGIDFLVQLFDDLGGPGLIARARADETLTRRVAERRRAWDGPYVASHR